ncbi:MAG: DUF4118 domain-containing protein [Chloroflexi bacterium]|nr:DUF4118 domain-containing protein [Chloroflexota bacterium]
MTIDLAGARVTRLARLHTILEMRWFGYVAGLAAVGLMSVVIGAVLTHINISNISMLYLIVVLATAIAFGRGPAILASVSGGASDA